MRFEIKIDDFRAWELEEKIDSFWNAGKGTNVHRNIVLLYYIAV